MSIFYSRSEDEKEITIVFKYRALQYWLMVVFVVAAVTPALKSYFLYIVTAYVVLVWSFILGSLSARREIKKAMATTGVIVSGKSLSFSNPLTYKIKK